MFTRYTSYFINFHIILLMIIFLFGSIDNIGYIFYLYLFIFIYYHHHKSYYTFSLDNLDSYKINYPLDYLYTVNNDGYISHIYVRPHDYSLFLNSYYELDYLLCGIDLRHGYRIYDYNRFIKINYDIFHLSDTMRFYYSLNKSRYIHYLNDIRLRYILYVILLLFCLFVNILIKIKI